MIATTELPRRGNAPVARLALKHEGLAKIRRLAKIEQDSRLAELMHIDPATISRVLRGKAAPGVRFIAGIVDVFGSEWFDEVFEVISETDDEDGTD
ncbi:helix-turn-helix domain-containing protein [Nocardia sp. CA-128927]|uniref:helix-turn-helix domain-containing protein n=1 Tax=Nocardia sp. CA-128927 TaxID=3239975 RepID=UPI003D958B77